LQHLGCKWLKTSHPHQNTPSARGTASVSPVFEGLFSLIVHTPSILRQYTLTLTDSSLLFCSKMKAKNEDTLLAISSCKDLLPPARNDLYEPTTALKIPRKKMKQSLASRLRTLSI